MKASSVLRVTTCYCFIDSPLGPINIQGDGEFVTGLYLHNHKGWHGPDSSWKQSGASFAMVREQLAEYFAGEREVFDVPLKLAGTSFQQRVWRELVRIPYGSTITYSELARRVGQPSASRAVGHANSRNPISILVPCHRVIGSSGKMTGYAGGVDKKRWLLDWESRTEFQRSSLFGMEDDNKLVNEVVAR